MITLLFIYLISLLMMMIHFIIVCPNMNWARICDLFLPGINTLNVLQLSVRGYLFRSPESIMKRHGII